MFVGDIVMCNESREQALHEWRDRGTLWRKEINISRSKKKYMRQKVVEWSS